MSKIKLFVVVLALLSAAGLTAADQIYLNGLNEVSYIYRTAEDSLNSYFRDAFSFNFGYRDFTVGMKFLAELPKYSTDQNQLLGELNSERLTTKWTERYAEFERDNLLLHGGTIAESFGSGMVFRAWEDLEFDTDTRLDGFLAIYNNKLKLKALYGALPNAAQPSKNDLAYGADAEYPLPKNVTLGATALTMRTLNPLGAYNQQDVWSGRINFTQPMWEGGVEYAATSLFKNSGANREGKAINAFTNIYLKPNFVQTLTLEAGYKYYRNFEYRLHDLKAFNYHNETLADNLPTGTDEEGLQGAVIVNVSDALQSEINYAEAWNDAYSKRMNDLYAGLTWQQDINNWLLEYGHIEKLDNAADHWQKELKPAVSLSRPCGKSSLTLKAECDYTEKQTQDITHWYYEPYLQADWGKGKVGVSCLVKNHLDKTKAGFQGLTDATYWAACELKYALFTHTDVTLFVGREAGGKVCRNGICRYVAPFQGVKLEATTRF